MAASSLPNSYHGTCQMQSLTSSDSWVLSHPFQREYSLCTSISGVSMEVFSTRVNTFIFIPKAQIKQLHGRLWLHNLCLWKFSRQELDLNLKLILFWAADWITDFMISVPTWKILRSPTKEALSSLLWQNNPAMMPDYNCKNRGWCGDWMCNTYINVLPEQIIGVLPSHMQIPGSCTIVTKLHCSQEQLRNCCHLHWKKTSVLQCDFN